jgi:hypothetical protein
MTDDRALDLVGWPYEILLAGACCASEFHKEHRKSWHNEPPRSSVIDRAKFRKLTYAEIDAAIQLVLNG